MVEKSTIVKTAEFIKNLLDSYTSKEKDATKKTFSILSNPEFLVEGTAIKI